MKKVMFIIGLMVLIFTEVTFAGIGAKNASNVSLGVFGSIKCSTGLTCTKSGQLLNMVSSPSLVGPLTLEAGAILSNPSSYDVSIATSGDSSLTVKGFEAKAAILNLYADEGDDAADKFSLASSADNTLSIRSNAVDKIVISTGGNLSGLGSNKIVGFAKPLTPATVGGPAITLAQCGGIFYNTAATQIDLPVAATSLGCSYTFVTSVAFNFDINPNGTDSIEALTNAAGDAIRNATVGNSVTLTATDVGKWITTSIYGTWSDIN